LEEKALRQKNMHFLLSLLGNIPATFWGVVVGSLFTLTGIYFTNRATDRRVSSERQMTFKKEIYAAAAAAISVSINALTKFCDLTFPLNEMSALYFDARLSRKSTLSPARARFARSQVLERSFPARNLIWRSSEWYWASCKNRLG
jgi:hypothetical protein